MKTYGSPIIAATILVLVAGNLSATASMRATMEQLLERGVAQQVPQSASAEWEDKDGLLHTIETPRMRGETDAELAVRHALAVRAFVECFPLED